MQHGAGQVEHRPQVGTGGGFGTAVDGGKQRRLIGQGQAVLRAFAGSGQLGADTGGHRLATVRLDQIRELLEDAVDRGQTGNFAGIFVHGLHPDRAERLGKRLDQPL